MFCYVSVRCLVLCLIVTLVCAFLSCVVFDCYVSARCHVLYLNLSPVDFFFAFLTVNARSVMNGLSETMAAVNLVT